MYQELYRTSNCLGQITFHLLSGELSYLKLNNLYFRKSGGSVERKDAETYVLLAFEYLRVEITILRLHRLMQNISLV